MLQKVSGHFRCNKPNTNQYTVSHLTYMESDIRSRPFRNNITHRCNMKISQKSYQRY